MVKLMPVCYAVAEFIKYFLLKLIFHLRIWEKKPVNAWPMMKLYPGGLPKCSQNF